MRRTTLLCGRALALAVLLLTASLSLARPALAQERVHVVGRGENLSTIALRYGLSQQELAAYNGVTNPNLVYVGQQLRIPGSSGALPASAQAAGGSGSGGYYTVAAGDSLSLIARNNGLTTDALMQLNGLSNANFVWVGQKLRVSARVPAVAQAISTAPETSAAGNIYVVRQGDTLSQIAARQQTTVQQLLADNGLPAGSYIYVGQRLRVRPAQAQSAPQPALSLAAAPANGKKWIEVNLAQQTLTAWQGDAIVMQTAISSGLSGSPTVTGRFTIGNKYAAQRMVGPGYDLPNVPWVMYFYSSYAIHGAYWHNQFGAPASHGCVNMRVNEAQMLYEWAPTGTEVYVHY